MTRRAVFIGIICVTGICFLTPYNNDYVQQTYLASNHLPLTPLFIILLLAVPFNVLLVRIHRGWEFSQKELATIVMSGNLQTARAAYLHWVGRAALELAGFRDPVPLVELAQQDCRAALDIDHLTEIQVDPFGFVRPDICPGVNLGNTRQHRVAELCRTQRVQETPLLRDPADQGPAALLPLARRFGLTVRSHYVDKCHLCFDLRRQLVAYLPEEFGPKHVYEVTA